MKYLISGIIELVVWTFKMSFAFNQKDGDVVGDPNIVVAPPLFQV